MGYSLFYERFDKDYRAELIECIHKLLSSDFPHYHEIRPDLKINFDNGRVYLERSRESARMEDCKIKTSSPQDIYDFIRRHVWYWSYYYSTTQQKQKDEILTDLKALIRKAEPNRKYSEPSIKTTQRTVMF
jgi:hypothetical protein